MTHDKRAGHKREGAGPQAGIMIQVQRVQKGRERPTSPNLPGAAFPDFQGDAGTKFLTDNLRRDKVCVCAGWIYCGVGLVLPLSPGFREVCAEGCANAGSLGVAKHVDQVQVGRDQAAQACHRPPEVQWCRASDRDPHRHQAD